jgi:hypothetical protein
MLKVGDLVRVVRHDDVDGDLAPVGSVGVIVDVLVVVGNRHKWPYQVSWFDTSRRWTLEMSEREIERVEVPTGE